MSNFILKVEVLAGTDIADAIYEAKQKCEELDLVYVSFDFNGISMSIGRNTDVEDAVASYHQALKECKKFVVKNSKR